MATFAELKTRVQRRLIDLPSAVLAEVPTLINKAIETLEKRHNYKVMETAALYVTTPGSSVLSTLPTDWKEPYNKPYRLSQFGPAQNVEWAATTNGPNLAYGPLDIGGPRFLYQGADANGSGTGTILVFPLPDSASDYGDGNYRVVIPYIKYLANLVNDGDSNWFTSKAEDYIVYRATSQGFALDWDTQNATVWAALAQEQETDVRKTDKIARLSGVDTLVPHYMGANVALLRS